MLELIGVVLIVGILILMSPVIIIVGSIFLYIASIVILLPFYFIKELYKVLKH